MQLARLKVEISPNTLHHLLFVPGMNAASVYAAAQITEFVSLLEVPFDTSVIEWRVTNTSKGKVNGC
jgi:hypothetical protein